jgi:hypothetical protein
VHTLALTVPLSLRSTVDPAAAGERENLAAAELRTCVRLVPRNPALNRRYILGRQSKRGHRDRVQSSLQCIARQNEA